MSSNTLESNVDHVALRVKGGIAAQAELVMGVKRPQEGFLALVGAPEEQPQNLLRLLPESLCVYRTASPDHTLTNTTLYCALYRDAFEVEAVLLRPDQDHLATILMDLGYKIARR